MVIVVFIIYFVLDYYYNLLIVVIFINFLLGLFNAVSAIIRSVVDTAH
jgi:hypothetical protein